MSQMHKLENRLKLKQENDWLRNAFRKAMNAAIEQGDNAAELTKALAVAIQKNGPVTITRDEFAALDPSTMLRADTDKDTGTTTYSVFVAEPMTDPDTPPVLHGTADNTTGGAV